MTWAGERSKHFCSFQSPEMFFLLTLPFIERRNRPYKVLELDFSGYATNQDLASQNVPTSLLTRNNFRLVRDTTHKSRSTETNPGGFGVQSERLQERR
jgi:hypothetical protein